MVKTLQFPRTLRLLTPSSFSHVFSCAIRVGSPYLTCVIRENQCGHPRIGFAIAKKQIKRAHERNRIKRLAREWLRLNQHRTASIDIVVMARTAAQTLPNRELVLLFENLLLRAIKKLSDDHHEKTQ